MRRQHHRLLVGMGAGRHPHRRLRPIGARRHGRRRRPIPFQVAGDRQRGIQGASGTEAFGIGRALAGDGLRQRQGMAEDGEPPVAPQRALGDARVQHQQRNAGAAHLQEQRRPDFGFQHQRDARPHATQERAHAESGIERQIGDRAIGQGQRLGRLSAGRCLAGDPDRHAGMLGAQRGQQRRSRLHLTERSGVQPDRPRGRATVAAQALVEEIPVRRLPQRTPQQMQRQQRQSRQQQRAVQQARNDGIR